MPCVDFIATEVDALDLTWQAWLFCSRSRFAISLCHLLLPFLLSSLASFREGLAIGVLWVGLCCVRLDLVEDATVRLALIFIGFAIGESVERIRVHRGLHGREVLGFLHLNSPATSSSVTSAAFTITLASALFLLNSLYDVVPLGGSNCDANDETSRIIALRDNTHAFSAILDDLALWSSRSRAWRSGVVRAVTASDCDSNFVFVC